MHRFLLRVLLPLFIALLLHTEAGAKVQAIKYGMQPLTDTMALQKGTTTLTDSLLDANMLTRPRSVIYTIAHPRQAHDLTTDFYVLLFLCFMLGVIRVSDTRYFNMLWKAFWNPTLSNRQLKDQLQGAGLSNILMNIFFTMVGGTYIYYVVKVFTPQRSGVIPASTLIFLLICGMMLIYAAKYAIIRFSGWAFRVEGVTEHYLFNVFLVNKILSIALIPFVIILAFADPAWAQPVVIVSFVLAIILIINRYIRSWQAFGAFFQYSKFHFFTYLCASEILPLAVLMKLLVQGLSFY